jgi:hypothetical protein
MSRLLDSSLRRGRAWVVPVVGLLLGLFAIVGLGEAEREPTPTDNAPDGYQSTEVTEALQAFPQGDDSIALVLFTAEGQLSQEQLAGVQQTFAEVTAEFADTEAAQDGGPGGAQGAGSGAAEGAGTPLPAGGGGDEGGAGGCGEGAFRRVDRDLGLLA